LARDGETVHVKSEGATLLRMPILTLGSIVCFGNVSCSPFLMGLCAERNVAISFLTEHGRFLARIMGPVNGNVLLRREQYRRADDDSAALQVAQWCVAGKMANCRQVLLRAGREHADAQASLAIRQSRPAWARGLKQLHDRTEAHGTVSRPAWARGSKRAEVERVGQCPIPLC
jgi:CRISP-associated protein Cas1